MFFHLISLTVLWSRYIHYHRFLQVGPFQLNLLVRKIVSLQNGALENPGVYISCCYPYFFIAAISTLSERCIISLVTLPLNPLGISSYSWLQIMKPLSSVLWFPRMFVFLLIATLKLAYGRNGRSRWKSGTFDAVCNLSGEFQEEGAWYWKCLHCSLEYSLESTNKQSKGLNSVWDFSLRNRSVSEMRVDIIVYTCLPSLQIM